MLPVTVSSFEVNMLKKKVFDRNFTWEGLVDFFKKSKKTLLKELRMKGLSQREIRNIEEQIEANEYYENNVAIIASEYFTANVYDENAFFDLNAHLYVIDRREVEKSKVAKELFELEYLYVFDAKDELLEKIVNSLNFASFSASEKKLIMAYYFFKKKGKVPMIITPDEESIRKFNNYDIVAMKI